MSESTLKDKLAALKAGDKVTPEVETQESINTMEAENMKEPAESKAKELFHVFYSTIISCRTVTTNGRIISFVGHKFVTNVQEEIDFLNAEIAQRNPYYYTKEGEEVVEADDLDPMKKLRKKFFEEFKAEQAKLAANIASGTLPESKSEAQTLVPGSTSDTLDVAAASDSVA